MKNIDIEASEVRFFSKNDESAFFSWLDKIACVDNYTGHLRTIKISIKFEILEEESFREIIALFYRYKIDMQELMKIEKPEFSMWLRNEKSYWFKTMFDVK